MARCIPALDGVMPRSNIIGSVESHVSQANVELYVLDSRADFFL
jgi:hypothetical protein